MRRRPISLFSQPAPLNVGYRPHGPVEIRITSWELVRFLASQSFVAVSRGGFVFSTRPHRAYFDASSSTVSKRAALFDVQLDVSVIGILGVQRALDVVRVATDAADGFVLGHVARDDREFAGCGFSRGKTAAVQHDARKRGFFAGPNDDCERAARRGVEIVQQLQDGDRRERSEIAVEVAAGLGWLIFGLPEAESAFHPAQTNDRHELYFMCDNLKTEIEALRAKGVERSMVAEERWGSITKIRLPGGGEIGLYQPKHPKP